MVRLVMSVFRRMPPPCLVWSNESPFALPPVMVRLWSSTLLLKAVSMTRKVLSALVGSVWMMLLLSFPSRSPDKMVRDPLGFVAPPVG